MIAYTHVRELCKNDTSSWFQQLGAGHSNIHSSRPKNRDPMLQQMLRLLWVCIVAEPAKDRAPEA
eukprot:2004926-Karenia_brevis.AAC.1